MMILLKQVGHVQDFLTRKRMEKGTLLIGFVPTLGALHEGHLSLIRRSKAENDLTVCSIYVNPTQFNDPKDLEKYPRPIEKDIALLLEVQCDILFLPYTKEIYPDGIQNLKDYDLGKLENFLEGASRPNHFKGVANVVDRLLQIVQPDRLYLGQKDFQQVKVIEWVVARGKTEEKFLPDWQAGKRDPDLSGLKSKIKNPKPEIIMCDIVREEDGLAMSSRNVRLTASQRINAAGISKELFFIRDHWKEFEPETLKKQAIDRINSIPGARVDYLEFCDAVSLTSIHDWKEAEHSVCVTAVKVGDVRLLDNVMIP